LDKLVDQQATDVVEIDQANKFKGELAKLVETARKASQEYTRDQYQRLVEEWKKLDTEIVRLLHKLVCSVPCWRCIVECYVCPLLNELHYAEKWLYDDNQRYSHVHDLYDEQYWHTKDKATKERRLSRIVNVLKAWESPAKTIQEAMAKNWASIKLIDNAIGSEPGKAIYLTFFRLIPLHLAIAPPQGSNWQTRIEKRFTKFCTCSQGSPDDCCGPDVGELSLRQRLIGPQPYLIDPNDYFKLICCLVEKRYVPAHDAVAKAAANLARVSERIGRLEDQLKDWVGKFDKAAPAAIPPVINCCDYEPADEASQTPRAY